MLRATIEFADWLAMAGVGRRGHSEFQAAASSGVAKLTQGTIGAANPQEYIFLTEVQFDGVGSGQVSFEFNGGNGSSFGGYAVQGMPVPCLLMGGKGLPVSYTIQNTVQAVVIVNVWTLSVPVATIDRLLADMAGAIF